MAQERKARKFHRNTVPVASRAADRVVEPARPAQRSRLDMAGVAVIVASIVMVMVTIAVPLNNFYSGNAELARLEESISAKAAEKERLLEEIDKYESSSYIEQEARRRLGVVKPGETAYRILDPQMTQGDTLTTEKREEQDTRVWYEVLWDSVATAPESMTQ
ncbi:septum formation initiator family protein [Corynebacterium lizhenjunii]|uniref:Septum formation initiator family protein n=1 Tax=Corynebacterium lizhenjunii TaxID=2709394 RepID=A0A7T0KFY5_9CORY|nr:septum formation initiator family protein [Corynebacterium lizhenjunii]QPK79867.1 septum formation initiator family protein [Corynebacterium lizhenjunii]